MRIGRSCIEQMRWGQNSMDEILAPVEGYYEDVFRIDVTGLHTCAMLMIWPVM